MWAAIAIAAAGLLVAALDQFLERRRTFAVLVAQGTPRGVLGRAAMLQVLLPLLPGAALAGLAGVSAGRGVYGDTAHANMGGSCSPPESAPPNWCDDPTRHAFHRTRPLRSNSMGRHSCTQRRRGISHGGDHGRVTTTTEAVHKYRRDTSSRIGER
ncbi:MAG: FtsX-like permease family protein [Pseudonocardiaceae bacterium]